MKILLLVAAIVSLAVALPASTPVRIQQLSSTEPGLCQMMYSYWTGGTPPYHLQLVDMNSLEVLQDIGIKKGHGNGHHFNWQIQVVPSRYVVLSITDSTRVRAVSEPFLIEMTGKEKCKYDRSPLDKDYYGYWYSSTELHPDRPKPSTPELLHFPMDGILRTCKPTKFEWWGGQSPYRIEIVGADNDELLEDLWIVIYDNRGGWIRTWTPDFVLKQGRVRVKITDVNGYIVSSQPFTIVNDEPSTCHPKTLALREPWHSTQSPLPTTTGDAALSVVTSTTTRFSAPVSYRQTRYDLWSLKAIYFFFVSLVILGLLSFKHWRRVNRILHYRRVSTDSTQKPSGVFSVWEGLGKLEKGRNSAEVEIQ